MTMAERTPGRSDRASGIGRGVVSQPNALRTTVREAWGPEVGESQVCWPRTSLEAPLSSRWWPLLGRDRSSGRVRRLLGRVLSGWVVERCRAGIVAVVFGQAEMGALGIGGEVVAAVALRAQQSAGIVRSRANAAASALDQGQSRSSLRWVRRP